MNKYGLLARDHWKKHAPQRYAALEDPEAYFETLGETAATQIEQISNELEKDLPPDLDYLNRVAQMRAIQKQAEEAVLTELVYSTEPETASLAEELEEMLGDLPSPSMIEASLQRLQEQAENEADREGRTEPLLNEEDQAKKDQLTALLPLVSLDREPDAMNEAELSDRILALRPFWSHESRSLAAPQ